ncbi:MAG TPA: hypothetical protein VHT27_14065 [Solirubrobacteraceae bacterium]|jgi:alkylation response protein AidB-like acyl-CoA dehydrogenase|nr:hypothetical protein [Solirubrobacteraceae bacterium]
MSARERAAPAAASLAGALERIASRSADLDRRPRFPAENFRDLADAGALAPPAGGLAGEVRLVRAVAAVDGSTARILDGHLNGVERLASSGPEQLRFNELRQIRKGTLLLGVWGADPVAGEGPPARMEDRDGRLVLRGVKTFCSGAGGVQRALVVAAHGEERGRLAYVDTGSGVRVDRAWYRASGLRSSESHRVEFHDTPVLALLGEPGELAREPWFSRDAVRTSATWAGLSDGLVAETVSRLDRARVDATQAQAVGRMRVALGTIDRWLDHTAAVLGRPGEGVPVPDQTALALECRLALHECARLIASLAARACGSRALVDGGRLDRARRDLDLFLLQHRLDPKLATLGCDSLQAGAR